jgi:hypothetical protein
MRVGGGGRSGGDRRGGGRSSGGGRRGGCIVWNVENGSRLSSVAAMAIHELNIALLSAKTCHEAQRVPSCAHACFRKPAAGLCRSCADPWLACVLAGLLGTDAAGSVQTSHSRLAVAR